MADIELVIKINEDAYKTIQRRVANPKMMRDKVDIAIANGIPLPKGHGRLGDLDELEKEMANGIKAGLIIEGYEEYSNINDIDDCLECVKYAPTIIEADKAESEDKE